MIQQEEGHRRKSLTAEDVENMRAESSEKVMRMLDWLRIAVPTWVHRERSSG